MAVHVATAGETYDCDLCAGNERNYCDSDGKRTWTSKDGRTLKSRGPMPEPGWPGLMRWGFPPRTTCAKPEMPRNWAALMSLHGAWLLGTLAVSGGLLEQPAPYVDAMNLIESERQKIEADKAKREADRRAQAC